MKASVSGLMMVVMLIATELHLGSSLPSTVPAFMWSHSPDGSVKDDVYYQTVSPKNLARSILAEGGWSNILCAGKSSQQVLDSVFVFIGKELQSADIAAGGSGEASVVELLKGAFTSSNFSMAFPYVTMKEKGTIENALLAEFNDACNNGLGVNNVVLVGSCSIEDQGYENLVQLESMHDYLAGKVEKENKGHPDLIVYCHGVSDSLRGLDKQHSERDVFYRLTSSLDLSGLKYSILYASDPHIHTHYSSRWLMGRLLSDATPGNESVNATICDGVCLIKTSLVEGILVGVLLLIILISGLCCMMGIDTPARFEAPQDS
ncbi:hypothetical protein Droror1_Dr00005257 [Drosera rotundifolia]